MKSCTFTFYFKSNFFQVLFYFYLSNYFDKYFYFYLSKNIPDYLYFYLSIKTQYFEQHCQNAVSFKQMQYTNEIILISLPAM